MDHVTKKIVKFPSESSEDVLTTILRDGARQLLTQAIQDEVAGYVEARDDLLDEEGRRQVVRNGYLPARTIQTPLGAVPVQQPRVRDRRSGPEREKFESSILPPYLKKTRSLEELLPWLYLKGVSTGDFSEALQALLGPDARGLSASTITRLKAGWEEEQRDWAKRSLKSKRDLSSFPSLPQALPRLLYASANFGFSRIASV